LQAGRLSSWRSAIENSQPLARALCIAVVIALICFELWSAISVHFDKPTTARPRAATAQATNVEQITAADLFGHAANQNANLPQTDLQVTLRAVFAASDPQMASAVIETGDGGTQIVKIGGAIGSAATLQAVHPNSVVLLRNGTQETLYFPAPQESPTQTVAQNTEVPNTSTVETVTLPPGASPFEIKRAAILQRLEELRAHSPR
jgi:type II secretory pathway component PulC